MCGLSWQVQPTFCWSVVHAIEVHQFYSLPTCVVLIEMKGFKFDPKANEIM